MSLFVCYCPRKNSYSFLRHTRRRKRVFRSPEISSRLQDFHPDIFAIGSSISGCNLFVRAGRTSRTDRGISCVLKFPDNFVGCRFWLFRNEIVSNTASSSRTRQTVSLLETYPPPRDITRRAFDGTISLRGEPLSARPSGNLIQTR